MKQAFRFILAAACLAAVVSCENTPVDTGGEPAAFGRGVFIVNEGQFLASNASISFYDPAKDSVENNIFYRVNQVPLGDVAHSMTIWEDAVFTVVNNSGRIYRTDRHEMKFQGKITGLTSPRYILVTGDEETTAKAYVSDLYSGKILVVEPFEDRVIDSIDMAGRLSTEQMIVHEGMLYAACWSYADMVMVIDPATDSLVDSIRVGKQPNSMAVDRNGRIWVLSDGGYPFSPYGQEPASLSLINTGTGEAETMKTWEDIDASPSDLCMNPEGDSLYFISGDVYKVSLGMQGFGEPFIRARGRQFYSLGVDPSDGTVYVGDAVDYQQDGWVYRFTPEGAAIDSFRVGVNPGHFSFTTGTQQ